MVSFPGLAAPPSARLPFRTPLGYAAGVIAIAFRRVISNPGIRAMNNPRTSCLRLGFAAAALTASAGLAEPKAPAVDTREGPVSGVSAPGIEKCLGIPYAAAPVGDLRWRPPQPHPRWHGVRDDTAFAAHCAQGASPFGLASQS